MNARLPVMPLIVLAALAACGPAAPDPAGLDYDADHPFLITLGTAPNAVMDALFQGRVVADGQGCVRLDGAGQVTVVWPRRFSLERRSGTTLIKDADGRAIGTIGGHFRLGGGEVPSLHPGIPLVGGTREEAMRRCPGLFWIVGTIPRD